MNDNEDPLYCLIQSIRDHTQFDHEIISFRIIETHISYVLLTGHFAYKFKKPLNLGFLDFGTLQRRKYFCDEEIRLNRRLAPELYVDVVAFTGIPARPLLNGQGPVLEYAVRMRQFDLQEQALNLLQEGKLTDEHMEQLARQLAQFHQQIAVAGSDSEFGEPQHVLQDALDNCDALQPLLQGDTRYGPLLTELRSWTEHQFNSLVHVFRTRKTSGYIRECHGDVHLGNIVRYQDRMRIFDCIEFSPALHWIDVINDLAFLIMDLHEHREPAKAQILLNQYLQQTGDFEGVKVLRFYLVYRALVRSKVAAIRLGQPHVDRNVMEQETGNEHRYLELARSYTRLPAPVLIITHGVSGSGKSTCSRMLSEHLAAIWIRSDLERKRLHGLGAGDRSHSGLLSGIYDPETTLKTYQRLAEITHTILTAGYSVIVDATFLQRSARTIFYQMARELDLDFRILDVRAEETVLRARIEQRQQRDTDASEADLKVLAYQLQHREPLNEVESSLSIQFNTSAGFRHEDIIPACKNLQRLVSGYAYPDRDTA